MGDDLRQFVIIISYLFYITNQLAAVGAGGAGEGVVGCPLAACWAAAAVARLLRIIIFSLRSRRDSFKRSIFKRSCSFSRSRLTTGEVDPGAPEVEQEEGRCELRHRWYW